MKSIEQLADENKIDLSNAQVDGMYRFSFASVYRIMDAIAGADSLKKPAFSLQPSAIKIYGQFLTKYGTRTLKPIAMLVSGEHVCDDGSFGYVITFKQKEEAGKYLGPEVVELLRKYIR